MQLLPLRLNTGAHLATHSRKEKPQHPNQVPASGYQVPTRNKWDLDSHSFAQGTQGPFMKDSMECWEGSEQQEEEQG